MTLGLVYEWPVVMRTCMLGKSYSVQWGEIIFEVKTVLNFPSGIFEIFRKN